MKKITLYITADKRPDFIPVQYETLKRYLKDDYEYIVLNNAIDSKKRRDAITRTCKELGVKCIEVKKDKRFEIIGGQKSFSLFGSYKNANVGTAYPLKWAWEQIVSENKNNLIVLIHSDMFLCAPISFNEMLGENDVAFIIQYRGLIHKGNDAEVTYPWDGVCVFNTEKIKNLDTWNWDCGIIEKSFINGHAVDVGGYSHFWLKENPISIKHVSEYAIHKFEKKSENSIWLDVVFNGNFHFSFTYDTKTKAWSDFHSYETWWQKGDRIFPHMPENFDSILISKMIKYFEKFILNKQTYPNPPFLGLIEFETYTEAIDPFIVHNKAGSGYMGFDMKYGKEKLAFIETTLGINHATMQEFRKKLNIDEIFEPLIFIKEFKRMVRIIRRTKIKNFKAKMISLLKKIKQKIKSILKKINLIKSEGLEKKMMKKLVAKESPVILEIGSANGTDTAEFLDLFKAKDFKLYGFEPEPKNIKIIKEKIHDDRYSLFEGVVSDTDGDLTFNRSRTDNPEDLSFSGSIMEPKNHLKIWDWIHFDEKMTVKSVKLDTFCNQKNIGVIDFIWCDVQGAEKKVIIGGENAFKNKVRYFYTEYADNEQYEGQPTLKEILDLLPNYKVVKDYGSDVLLKNTSL